MTSLTSLNLCVDQPTYQRYFGNTNLESLIILHRSAMPPNVGLHVSMGTASFQDNRTMNLAKAVLSNRIASIATLRRLMAEGFDINRKAPATVMLSFKQPFVLSLLTN